VVVLRVGQKNPETKEVTTIDAPRLVFKGEDFTQIVSVGTK